MSIRESKTIFKSLLHLGGACGRPFGAEPELSPLDRGPRFLTAVAAAEESYVRIMQMVIVFVLQGRGLVLSRHRDMNQNPIKSGRETIFCG